MLSERNTHSGVSAGSYIDVTMGCTVNANLLSLRLRTCCMLHLKCTVTLNNTTKEFGQ